MESEDDTGDDAPWLIPVVVGSAFILLVLLSMIMIFLRIKKKKKQSAGSSMDGQLEHGAQDGNAWQEAVDESGRMFYHNPATGETSWDNPGVAFGVDTYSNFHL